MRVQGAIRNSPPGLSVLANIIKITIGESDRSRLIVGGMNPLVIAHRSRRAQFRGADGTHWGWPTLRFGPSGNGNLCRMGMSAQFHRVRFNARH